MRTVLLQPGDPAPWFIARSRGNPRYRIDTAAGRWLVLCFFPSSRDERVARRLAALLEDAGRFDDRNLAFFGMSLDPGDWDRLRDRIPGVRFLLDPDGAASRLCGAVGETDDAGTTAAWPQTLILDPSFRVFARVDFADPDHDDRVGALIRSLPRAEADDTGAFAPVLVLPRVFEPELCRRLIALYDRHGGEESGVMREVDGKTVGVHDHSYKRRDDHTILDEEVRALACRRIERRVVPEIHKAFNFAVTRMERYIVACYDAASGGHFRAHRDNTTRGTAHRRFAVSINLNAEDYEGGELRFPEHGPRTYRAPTGGAVVFSGTLLHEVTPVTSGRRYAFLPFLYDEAAARLRERNNGFLGDAVGQYQAE
ncbi:putative 2-oxoglutarate/Fe(II)-dependent dioxygenase YbiX/peroxiredoxin [Azospirillum agricola]|uniref:2OG-Fe(II) oxygenase n=1 Tax=Azospirillum agricola TaxID=1720247 RepID=UPI001AE9DBCB|nr:2OG-Fe(II) oxygenase [Azospirillum agricola]MBP2233157.1 putative 2-oxoglutarate/Fe(II)-dependent dioxygenase YbiX/peroxiredoxin [Azospirillum agricola]